MTNLLKIVLPKLYWPCIGIYLLVFLALIMLYFTEIDNWSDRSYYNWMNFKRIFIAGIIPTASMVARFSENARLADLILFVPTALVLVFLLLAVLVMFIFSKSI